MPRFKTPAPGSYDVPDFLKIGGNAQVLKRSASFASSSKREVRNTLQTSDPGLYDPCGAGMHLGSKETIASRNARSFNVEASQGMARFNSTAKRMPSPPARAHRGGPGEHDFSHLYGCGAGAPSATSSFRSSSPLAGHIRRSTTPQDIGPGFYDPKEVESKQGRSSWGQGKSERNRQLASQTGELIGPGTYNADQKTIANRMRKNENRRGPGFNSSTPRIERDD